MHEPVNHSDRAATRMAAATVLFAALLGMAARPASANTYTVTNTADSGAGSLREAITNANGNSGLDTIAFDINTSIDSGCTGTPKICTIQPATALPLITSPVYLDGYSQPGSSMNTLAVGDDAVLVIEIDATNAVALFLYQSGASGSTIRGLAVTHAYHGAITVYQATDATITGNFIGTDATGTSSTVPQGNGTSAIYSSASGTVIGGTAPADRNVIVAGNAAFYANGTSACTVQGNYIAVDKSGEVPLYSGIGVGLEGTSNCLIGGGDAGAGNVFGKCGSCIDSRGSNNVIQGNLIGTDATGTISMGGTGSGIAEGGTDDQIGGTGATEGNVISGNALDGIRFVSSANTPTGTLIEGNLIGTDATGMLPLPNGWCGIDNQGVGYYSIAIGGTNPGAGNIIAFNGTNGIDLTGTAAIGWSILDNSIYANGGLGITLNGSCGATTATPTANDDGDADTGANNWQNYPVVTTVTIGPNTTAQVSGTLNSTTDSMFHIEFFANASCDAKGNGEGRIFIGSTDVTTTGNDASFGPLDCTVPAERHVITATATDAGGNTSEFSECATQDSIFTDGLEQDDVISPACVPSI